MIDRRQDPLQLTWLDWPHQAQSHMATRVNLQCWLPMPYRGRVL